MASTSRLKRKAEYDPDLLAGNNLAESFVAFGTALPSLASTKKDQGEYVPVWKQEVRDEKGRRRLHGAFTGGFSAGYFNTAGSKEGWTPSTFVSSKEAKGKGKATARPEDFMDEEDLADIKASRTFSTTDEYASRPSGGAADIFAGEGGASGSKDPTYSSAVANSLKDLVKPGSSRIGEKIMQRMGWRPGQGVGPRLTYERRKEVMKDLGLSSQAAEEEDEPPEEAKKHLYAPVDRPLMTFDGKDNQWGLGYVPGANLADSLASTSRPAMGPSRAAREDEDDGKTPKMPRGGAFGISALEDADEDDEDVYGSGMNGRSSMIMHDDEDDEDAFMPAGMGARRRPELLKSQNSKRKPEQRNGMQSQTKRKPPDREIQKFSDGSPIVPGFVLASRPQQPDKWFPAPQIPKGWQPNPKAVIERDRIKAAPLQPTSGNQAQQPVPGQKGKHNMLSADARSTLLGEPVAPKSVFDFMSAKNRERLAGLAQSQQAGKSTANQDDWKSTSAPMQAQPEPDVQLDIPSIEPRIAQAALKGFMPYGDDLAKRARYTAFLTHAAVPSGSTYAPQPLPGRKMADLNKELADFANAAAIFKPMSGMMANRFTSGSTASALLAVEAQHAGLQRPTGKAFTNAAEAAAFQEEEEARKKKEQEERDAADPRRAAARAGMFGPLTRSTEPFYPARLVCKRFNVADPHPEGPAPAEQASFGQPSASSANPGAASEVLGQDAIDEIMKNRSSASAQDVLGLSTISSAAERETSSDPVQTSKEQSIPTLANVGLGEDESQGRDTLTYQKPSMDIFRAIFADSEDEDEQDERDTQAVPPVDQPTPASNGAAKAMEIDDPSALPNGSIFASRRAKQEESVPMTMDSIATFKPSFVSKSDRTTTGADGDGKKEKKQRKKKTSSAAIVSFDMDDGEETAPRLDMGEQKKAKKRRSDDSGGKEKDKKAKKEKKAVVVEPIEEEDEWIEKPAAAPRQVTATAEAPGRKNGRMRASELF